MEPDWLWVNTDLADMDWTVLIWILSLFSRKETYESQVFCPPVGCFFSCWIGHDSLGRLHLWPSEPRRKSGFFPCSFLYSFSSAVTQLVPTMSASAI